MAKQKEICVSQNISWTIQRGSWTMHFILTFFFWIVFSQIFGQNKGWQLTVICYNIITFLFFHWIVGDPFDSNYRDYTFWEQITVQLKHTPTLIFMSVYPVLLFMLANRMAVWNTPLYFIAIISLVLVVVPKLGFMHMKRIFGINRHD
ncbi:hypothetical protein ENBRE01_0821 [Enteropsectra breve]|nr:hypothetical protein ENBRE01_0821 [Enteropsectra breve]